MIETLLAGGADPNLRDAKGTTPLASAAAEGHLAAIRALLAAGASTALRDGDGVGALHHAARGGHAGKPTWDYQPPACAIVTLHALKLSC